MTATAQLLPFPGSPPCPIDSIAVRVFREDRGGLRLRFELLGEVQHVLVPATCAPRAADGLWAHTCCEAFVATPGRPAYREFNFSPSGEWAIYDFDAYRQRSAPGIAPAAPMIVSHLETGRLVLDATLDATALPQGSPLELGLTTVVETLDGTLSYWALRHPGERPDFHLRDAFTLPLARP
ncbi:DOMON-like domain-containing protein [Aromatoleum evansii]|uniref:DOMON-like domain-containing protein n=1 Tax=Aromatoleum evansii TaxID=59406 RepID=UPI00145E6C6C|nr:DOMON-like domain-containing protein [Aromatoleum evansii]NMG29387.1 hypothetical protein [Aromatoleum evansii]